MKQFYLIILRIISFKFHPFSRNIMTHLKLVILLFVSITIFSCYSIESDCPDYDGDIIWELAGKEFPDLNYFWYDLVVANNGNIWAYEHYGYELYLSTNNGDTWVKKNNTPFINILCVSPVNGYLFALGESNKKVFISTDNGENWENVLGSGMNFNRIFITESGEIYAGDYKPDYEGGELLFYYSNDNGNTWIEKFSALKPFWFTALALGKDGTLYAGSSMGVHRSTDGGVTWLPPANYDSVFVNRITICDDGSIFATTSTYGATILKSTDKGVNWNNVNTGFDFVVCDKIIFNPVTKDIFISAMLSDNGWTGYPSQLPHRIYRSTNSGRDWKLENSGLSDQIFDLAVNPNTGKMFAGTHIGVYRTKNYPK